MSLLKRLALVVSIVLGGSLALAAAEIVKVAQTPISLETPIGEEEDSQLGERFRQIEAKALRKLRHPLRGNFATTASSRAEPRLDFPA